MTHKEWEKLGKLAEEYFNEEDIYSISVGESSLTIQFTDEFNFSLEDLEIVRFA